VHLNVPRGQWSLKQLLNRELLEGNQHSKQQQAVNHRLVAYQPLNLHKGLTHHLGRIETRESPYYKHLIGRPISRLYLQQQIAFPASPSQQ
jgi:hypothetical protein